MGIGIGAAVAAIAIGVLLFLLLQSHRQRGLQQLAYRQGIPTNSETRHGKPEMTGEPARTEMTGESAWTEMTGEPARTEMPAALSHGRPVQELFTEG